METTIEKMKKGYAKSLFDGDADYEEQMDEAARREEIQKAQSFLGFNQINSCTNCNYQMDGKCYVMANFNQNIVFETCNLYKCKHWTKQK